jgi:hypothetical protein
MNKVSQNLSIMKTSKHFFLLKWAPVILLFAFLVQACKKSDNNPGQNDPKYVGTWLDMRSVNQGGVNVEVKNVLTLSSDSLNYLAQYGLTSVGPWIVLFKMNGTAADSAGMVLKISVSSVSVPKYDSFYNVTGYTVYKQGDPQFTQMLSQYDFEQSFGFMYSITGNQMTLKHDFNHDGNFTDLNETIVYTKQ